MTTSNLLQTSLRNCLLAIMLGLVPTSVLFAAAKDSSGITVGTRQQSLTRMQATCFTHLKMVSSNPNTGGTFPVFPQLATPAQGGVLCPGKYNVSNFYCVISTQGGCGGDSCGWGGTFYTANGTNIGSVSSHWSPNNNCTASHGNVCEDDGNVKYYFTLNKSNIDTNTDTGTNSTTSGNMSVALYNESGGTTYSGCFIEVTASTLY